MTHGEEPGPETHQDSAVLTYLEGLLMHQVSGGQAATATQRCQAGHGNQEQGNSKASAPGQGQPNHAPRPPQGTDQERTAPHTGVTQHPKKARLLRSEAWVEHESRKSLTPPTELNGQRPRDLEEHATALNGSAKCKGESTLLASLLQSFSSRLQNVALSQQLVQSLKQQQVDQQEHSSHVNKGQQEDEKEAGPCRESASSRLKGLIKKNKAQAQSNSVPYQRKRVSQERQSESPKVLQKNSQSSSTESLSCAERLKAVANLVNIRSSPAPSPRPSVACSQLALLLSSEAHLQQYSREQALKAQLAGRSASERLAAMATQKTQDTKQMTTSDTVSSLHAKNGSAPTVPSASSRQSPSGTPPGQGKKGGSPKPLLPFRERRPFERPFASRPSQNCSSLLLQLLNNHNTQHQLNSQGHLRSDLSTTPTRGSPVLSDGGHSSPDSSFPKDSSDAESSSSSCSPIDLSFKGRRVSAPPPVFSSSSSSSTSSSPALDRITEGLINKWKPDPPPASAVCSKDREPESNPEMKPHHKVTLLQLLLDHKNNGNVNKSLDNPDLQPVIIPKVSGAPVARQTVVNRCEEIRTHSPQSGLVSKSPLILPALSYSKDTSSASSPYSLYDSSHSQSIPLDLCKSKSFPSEPSLTEPAFSASKLLQNLAQSGKQNVSSSPPLKTSMPSVQRHPQEMKLDHSVTLLERLTTPVQQSLSPRSEGTYLIPPRRPESSQSTSEIENLLERRTVLQLLLGNATSKDKVGGKRKREAVRGNCQEKQSSLSESLGVSKSPVRDVAVKTEPRGEHHDSDHDRQVNRSQSTLSHDSCRSSPLSLPNVTVIKQEPKSPETVPRDGLLSHLLKQPRAVLFSTPDNSQKVSVKEEQQEHQGPTIPKKRKYSMEPKAHPTGSESCMLPDSLDTQKVNNGGSSRGSGACSASGLPGSPEVKGPRSPPVADSPPVRCPVSESPPNDSRGFNVLKQLLLSNNCLREPSQPGGPSGSPKHSYTLNGSRVHQPSGHSGEAGGQSRSPVPLHSLADPRSGNSGLLSHSAPGSPWGVQGTPQSPKPKPAPTIGDEDSQPDSPRLMRSNPILYYMLQKGNADLLKERERSRTASQVQVKVKEEPLADMQGFEHVLSPRHTGEDQTDRSQSESHRLNGSLKKCQ